MKSFLLVQALGFCLAGILVSLIRYNDIAFSLSFSVSAILVVVQLIDHRNDGCSGGQP